MRVAWSWFAMFSLAAINMALWGTTLGYTMSGAQSVSSLLLGVGLGIHAGIAYMVEKQKRESKPAGEPAE